MYIYYALHARLNCQGSNVSGDVKEMGDVTCPKAEDDDARSTRAGSVMSNTDTINDDLLSLSYHACMMEGNISHVYHGCAFREQCIGATIRSRHRQFRNAAADPDTAKKAIADDVKGRTFDGRKQRRRVTTRRLIKRWRERRPSSSH